MNIGLWEIVALFKLVGNMLLTGELWKPVVGVRDGVEVTTSTAGGDGGASSIVAG